MPLPFRAWAECSNLGSVVKEGGSVTHCNIQQLARCSWYILPTLTVLLSRRVPQGFSSVWQEANRSPSTITPVYGGCCQPQARHSHYATLGAFPTKFAPGRSGVVFPQPSAAFAPGNRGLWSAPHLSCSVHLYQNTLGPRRWGDGGPLPLPTSCHCLVALLPLTAEIQPNTGGRITNSSKFAWEVPHSREPP